MRIWELAREYGKCICYFSVEYCVHKSTRSVLGRDVKQSECYGGESCGYNRWMDASLRSAHEAVERSLDECRRLSCVRSYYQAVCMNSQVGCPDSDKTNHSNSTIFDVGGLLQYRSVSLRNL